MSEFCLCVPQRFISKDGNLLSKPPSGMQSGGEEEQDEEAHTPLPPPMEIIKDPSAQDDKVRGRRLHRHLSPGVAHLESETDLQRQIDEHVTDNCLKNVFICPLTSVKPPAAFAFIRFLLLNLSFTILFNSFCLI